MNTKDQEFIDAMHDVVREKGSEHTAGNYYWQESEPTCIVGCAAYTAWGIRLDEFAMADTHLTKIGCSEKVAVAGRAAQHFQDARMEWGTVLGIFDLALEMFDEVERPTSPVCSCSSGGCNWVGFFHLVNAEYLRGRRAQTVLARKDHALVA